MNNSEKLNEQLPRKETFYGSLTSKTNSDKEYEHVLKVWNTFQKEKKLKEYHDLYLKYGVLLLVDVFEKFRNGSLKIMGYARVII